MTNLKEIEFALKNGFTNVTVGTEKDGTPYVMGTFGYIATSNENEYNEMINLISQYVELTPATATEEKAEKNNSDFTKKELKVIEAIADCSMEYGLPVSVDEIKDITGMSKRSIVGVISSLYKKDILESYEVDQNTDEFHFTESAFNEYVEKR